MYKIVFYQKDEPSERLQKLLNHNSGNGWNYINSIDMGVKFLLIFRRNSPLAPIFVGILMGALSSLVYILIATTILNYF